MASNPPNGPFRVPDGWVPPQGTLPNTHFQQPNPTDVPHFPPVLWGNPYNVPTSRYPQAKQLQPPDHQPKRQPRAPSAEYLATSLSDNPLGLTNMIPAEELGRQQQQNVASAATPWIWTPRSLESEDPLPAESDEDIPPPATLDRTRTYKRRNGSVSRGGQQETAADTTPWVWAPRHLENDDPISSSDTAAGSSARAHGPKHPSTIYTQPAARPLHTHQPTAPTVSSGHPRRHDRHHHAELKWYNHPPPSSQGDHGPRDSDTRKEQEKEDDELNHDGDLQRAEDTEKKMTEARKELEVNQKAEDLSHKENALVRREKDIKNREHELAKIEAGVWRRQREVGIATHGLDDRERELTNWWKELKKKEEELEHRRTTLESWEEVLTNRERELKGRDPWLWAKEFATSDAETEREKEGGKGGVLRVVKAVLEDKECYRAFLSATGRKAQQMLDILDKLLVDYTGSATTRRSLLMALMRLSTTSGLYPKCLVLHDIRHEEHPITAGQFGEIRRGAFGDLQVCLKVVKLYQRAQIDHLLKSCAREAILWSHLDHPNLLPFYGIYRLGDSYGRVSLVSPWMENGNVSDYLKNHPNTPRMPLIHDIMQGLRHLHGENIVHGDLKAVNILVTSSGSACLADFGLSSVMDADILRWTSLDTMTQAGGTARWIAPELMDEATDGTLQRPNFASDIYSVGSVMYEVLSGQIPFYEFSRDVTVISKVIQGVRPTRPSLDLAPEMTDNIWEVLTLCWMHDPKNRPDIQIVIRQLPPWRARQEGIEGREQSQNPLGALAFRNSMRRVDTEKVAIGDMEVFMRLLCTA